MMNYKKDKGTAGLTIIISIITMLFVIGLLTMIFALMGDKMAYSTMNDASDSYVNASVTGTFTNTTSRALNTSIVGYQDIACSISYLRNSTGDIIATSNYTTTGTGNCYVLAVDGSEHEGDTFDATYTTTYLVDTDASSLMDDTITGIEDVPDWFSIIIVIGFMVVLILLVSIIITAIRGTGLMGMGGGDAGGGTGGSA